MKPIFIKFKIGVWIIYKNQVLSPASVCLPSPQVLYQVPFLRTALVSSQAKIGAKSNASFAASRR